MLAIEYVRTTDLMVYERNPRTHSREQIAQLAAMIHEVGFLVPVLLDDCGVLIAGHGRREAALQLGLTEIPAIRAAHLSPDQVRAMRIADNQLAANAGYDLAALTAEVKALAEANFNLSSLGFSDDYLAAIMADNRRALERARVAEDAAQMRAPTVEPAAPVPPDPGPQIDRVAELQEKWKTAPGQLWEIPSVTMPGKSHRLLCGDSTAACDVERLMNGERALLCATDPPYLVDYDGTNHPQSFEREQAGKDNNKKWDEYNDPAASVEFFAAFFRNALEVALVDNPALYQWHASRRQGLVEQAWEQNGLLLHQQLIWVKSRPILTRSHFMWQHEPCFYGWVKGKPPSLRPTLGGENSTVWTIDQKGEQDGIHPTQKPLEIFTRPISYHTQPGDICLEMFSGSGSQLVAAEQLGRRCYAMELAPGFVAAALERLAGMGLKPAPAE